MINKIASVSLVPTNGYYLISNTPPCGHPLLPYGESPISKDGSANRIDFAKVFYITILIHPENKYYNLVLLPIQLENLHHILVKPPIRLESEHYTPVLLTFLSEI